MKQARRTRTGGMVVGWCLLTGAVWGADGVPPTDAGRAPLRLTLKRAVELALSPEGNAYIQIAQENLKQAQARSAQARAALLPNLDSMSGFQNMVRSLTSQGLREINLPFGIQLPERVGPFEVADYRVSVGQTVLDVSAIRRLQAAHTGVRTAEKEGVRTEDEVTSQVAKAYVAALRAEADLQAAQANEALAQAVLQLAQHQKQAGTGTGIEITRARVQLSNEKQRLLAARNQRRQAHLQLLRVMNLRLDTELELADQLSYAPVPPLAVEKAEAEAIDQRPDLAGQQQKENAARLAASAVGLERLPSLVSYADYGTTGAYGGTILPTRTVAVGIRVPLWDGGRRAARRAESTSLYHQERIRSEQLREQIRLEVRLALDSLHSAEEQYQVSEEGLALAESELQQARRRYEAGVANSLEVTDAQTRLERARDNRITALFGYNLARIDLGHALGNTRSMIP